MKKEELAAMINGREYRDEVTKDIERIAEENNLVICFGASDDLLELRGSISDEYGAYDGETIFIYITPKGKMKIHEGAEENKVNALIEDFGGIKHNITSEWCPEDEEGEVKCSWEITSSLPYASFNIYEDGELYCIGCVIDLKDITTPYGYNDTNICNYFKQQEK